MHKTNKVYKFLYMLLKVHLGIKRLELPVFGLGKERQFDEVAA